MGFIGIAIILRPSSSPSHWHVIGLISGLTLALSMVGTRILSSSESSGKILFYYNAISVLLSLPIAILNWHSVPLWTLPYLLYIGISVFLAMWCYTKAYSYAKTSVISPIGYFSVVNAGLFGWIFWDHIPDNIALLGIAVVIIAGLSSVLLSARER
jgi:drug/metabolite transporter (DMT)-like permease